METRIDARIPTRDGITLSANLFLPATVERVPAVLNMDPYRKDDWSAGWDLALGAWFAEHGYAYCRLDVRGTGSSDGIAIDEYAEAETLDGHDAVEWLAAQPWCTGAVGMWGLSYGGFTSIQVAATRPPHLRAIVPIQATDDRYTDDVHYVGGALVVSELAQYAVSQVAMNALPAPVAAWGDRWLERWRQRLDATPVWLFAWARAQRDGPYWRRGSLRPDYGQIQAAVLHFGGWMDEYVDAALRMQALCTNAAGRRTIIGAWVHGLPDSAYPAPNIDWRHEMLRWFDRWLRDIPNGADAEPPLTWHHREPSPPERFPARLNGAWRAAANWPPTAPANLVLALARGTAPGRGRLVNAEHERGEIAGPAHVESFDHHPTAGMRAGSLCWGAGHPPNGLAGDLRLERDAGPTFTSDPLSQPIDVLGPPVAILHVASLAPVAHLVLRLGCVAPDGAIEQVCEGILNLTHRASHASPAPLEPGHRYEVRVPLRGAGYHFPAGHRIELSIASAHWPVIWPSPGRNTLQVHLGPDAVSRLELPLAPTGMDLAVPPPMNEQPVSIREQGATVSEPTTWEASDDPQDGTSTIRTHEGDTTTLPDGTSTLYVGETLLMSASAREPGQGRFENACEYRLERDGSRVRVVADGTTVTTATAFDMRVAIHVELDGAPFFDREWHEVIERDLL